MIPIIIKDPTWSQNSSEVTIILEVKNVSSRSTDVVSSGRYLKVHSGAYFWEAFLSQEVDEEESECQIDENGGKIVFRLKKIVKEEWRELEDAELTKEEKREIRREAVERSQQKAKEEKAEKEKRRFDRKQATVHDQIRLDAEAKAKIEAVKVLETARALKSVDLGKEEPPEEPSGNEDIFSEEDISTAVLRNPPKKRDEKMEVTVGIRPTVCIPVSFTPRSFPTPSRESTHAEEQEWLKKQTEARKLSGFVDEDLRPEERNPDWLLAKGQSLLRTSSYLGAVSAFSLGIRLAPKMAELYVHRARAHLPLQNYSRVVEDSSQALELLTPKVESNLEDRFASLVVRSQAFVALDMFPEAAQDLEAALLLKPGGINDETLSSLRTRIQEALEKEAESSLQ